MLRPMKDLPQDLSEKVLQQYLKSSADHPWRKDWQDLADPYRVWVSEIMLQQTTLQAVTPVYRRFMHRYPDVHSLASAEQEQVLAAVQGLGYYRRFRYLHKAAQYVVEQYQGHFPRDYQGWLELPGIGPYSAAAISSICFSEPRAVVDGNVIRVLARFDDLQLAVGTQSLTNLVEERAQQLLHKGDPGAYNQAIMEIGQTICRKSEPDCARCPLSQGCLAYARGTTALAPKPKPSVKKTEVNLALGVYEDGGKVALQRRPQSARFLKGILGFPTLAVNELGLEERANMSAPLTVALDYGERVGVYTHFITRFRLKVSVYRMKARPERADASLQWLPKAQVDQALTASLDRKAWKVIESSKSSIEGS